MWVGSALRGWVSAAWAGQYHLCRIAPLGKEQHRVSGAGMSKNKGHTEQRWALRRRHSGSHQNSTALQLSQWWPEEGKVERKDEWERSSEEEEEKRQEGERETVAGQWRLM